MSLEVTKTIKTYNDPNPYTSNKTELRNSPLVPESEAAILSSDLFKKFDKNKNGKLDPEEMTEFKKYIDKEFSRTKSEHLKPESIFSTAEIDSDGCMSRSEFNRWVKINLTYPNHLVDTISLEKWSDSTRNRVVVGTTKKEVVSNELDSEERRRRELLSGSVLEENGEEVRTVKTTTETNKVDPLTGKTIVETTVEEEITIEKPKPKPAKLTVSNYTNDPKPTVITEITETKVEPIRITNTSPGVRRIEPVQRVTPITTTTTTTTNITSPAVKPISSFPRINPVHTTTTTTEITTPIVNRINSYPTHITGLEGSRRVRPITTTTIEEAPRISTHNFNWNAPVQRSIRETVTIDNSGVRSWTRPEPPIILPDDLAPSLSRGYTPSPDKAEYVETRVYEGETHSTVFRPPEGTYPLTETILPPGSHYQLPHGASYSDIKSPTKFARSTSHTLANITPTSYDYSHSRLLTTESPIGTRIRSRSPSYITNTVPSTSHHIVRESSHSPIIRNLGTGEAPYNLTQTISRPSNTHTTTTTTTNNYILGGGGLGSTISFSPNKLRQVSNVSETTLGRSFITPTRIGNSRIPNTIETNPNYSFLPSSFDKRYEVNNKSTINKVDLITVDRSRSPSPAFVQPNTGDYTATIISNGVRRTTPLHPKASYTELSPERICISPERIWTKPNNLLEIERTQHSPVVETTHVEAVEPVIRENVTRILTPTKSPIVQKTQVTTTVNEPIRTYGVKTTIEPSVFNAPSTQYLETTPKSASYRTQTIGDRTVYAAYQTPSAISSPYREVIHPSRIRKGDPYEVGRTNLGFGTPIKSYSVVDDSNPKVFKTRDENFEYNTEILKRSGYVETSPSSIIGYPVEEVTHSGNSYQRNYINGKNVIHTPSEGISTPRIMSTERIYNLGGEHSRPLTPTHIPVGYSRHSNSPDVVYNNYVSHSPAVVHNTYTSHRPAVVNQTYTTTFNPNDYTDNTANVIYNNQPLDGDLLQALNRTFDRYDVNNSNFIERDEIPALMKDTYLALGYIFEPNEADIDSYMKNMDLSKDGLISREEFVTVCSQSLRDRGIIA